MGRGATFSWLVALVVSGCTSSDVRLARPPTAFAGFDVEAFVGDTVVLDGTRSVDPDGDRLAYRWELVARPDDSIASVTRRAEALAALSPDEPGAYVVSLTVSDGDFVSRDLVGLFARVGTSTAPEVLALEVEPRSCNADAGDLSRAPCGITDRRISIAPRMLVYPEGVDTHISWSFLRLPLGATIDEVDMLMPGGPRGPLTFVPPRPGEYWIEARLIGPTRSSAPSIATVGVFDVGRAAAERPRAQIDAPQTARAGGIILFDGRGSFVPTSSGARARTWNLLASPSGSTQLSDVATGCPVDECRRLNPNVPGTYFVSYGIDDGVTAVTAVEVSP